MESILLVEPHRRGQASAQRYEIDATRAAGMPGIHCRSCGDTWAYVGIIYPAASPEAVEVARRQFPRPGPVSVEVFHDAVAAIQPLIGFERPLLPGAELGHLVGRVVGTMADFAWLNMWTPIVQSTILQDIQQRGLTVRGAAALLESADSYIGASFEIEAWPSARLHRTCVENLRRRACVVCGRDPVELPQRMIIDRQSLAESQFLQRIREFPSFLVACGRNAAVLRELNPRDLCLTELEVR